MKRLVKTADRYSSVFWVSVVALSGSFAVAWTAPGNGLWRVLWWFCFAAVVSLSFNVLAHFRRYWRMVDAPPNPLEVLEGDVISVDLEAGRITRWREGEEGFDLTWYVDGLAGYGVSVTYAGSAGFAQTCRFLAARSGLGTKMHVREGRVLYCEIVTPTSQGVGLMPALDPHVAEIVASQWFRWDPDRYSP